jgi:predicted glutamine amidotransferase
MCRILFKKDNTILFDKVELEESYRSNPDGTGLLYYDSVADKMVVKKWLSKTPFETIYKKIQEVESMPNAKCVGVHFRIGTSGGKGIEQIHPIHIDGDKYLFHNGVCREFEVNNNASDTQWIAWFLKDKKFELKEIDNEINKHIYENIFSGNKLLIVEKDKFKFVNEGLGV